MSGRGVLAASLGNAALAGLLFVPKTNGVALDAMHALLLEPR